MPRACANASLPTRGPNFDHLPMAFCVVGLDLIDPFSAARKGAKFIVMTVNYFTKWVEVEALVTITAQAILNF